MALTYFIIRKRLALAQNMGMPSPLESIFVNTAANSPWVCTIVVLQGQNPHHQQASTDMYQRLGLHLLCTEHQHFVPLFLSDCLGCQSLADLREKIYVHETSYVFYHKLVYFKIMSLGCLLCMG